METVEKLKILRQWMEQQHIDACVVLSGDAHMSEYVGEHWKSRRWLTGFTGSAGTAVITRGDGGLWTDGRYFIQAERELAGSGIRLFRMTEPGVLSWEEWLAETLPDGARIAVDGRTLSVTAMGGLSRIMEGKPMEIVTEHDPVGAVWTDRPDIPLDPIMVLGTEYVGVGRSAKLAQIRKAMSARRADYYLLSALDEICWLYNIRGRDIPCNPYVTAYAVVGPDQAYLFTNPVKAEPETKALLEKDGVEIRDYAAIYDFLQKLPAEAAVQYDPEKTSVRVLSSLPAAARKIEASGLVTLPKAIKNDTEIGHTREAYLKDAVALVQLFKWLKEAVPAGGVTEVDVERKILELRSRLPLFVEPSFSTIAAYGPNAAMMHYSPSEENPCTLEPKSFFLLDSGAHFFNGTTDITRTLAMGPITAEEKKDFTLVLKSVIALSTARFLYGTTGSNLDVLARKPMWDNGLDYKCGTGHGVGFFSNVHENPQRFSHKPNLAVLEPGMFITVEPGVYKEGLHGIRTENTLLVVEDITTPFGGRFLKFETLCFLPVDRSALDASLLTEAELEWINAYHAEVYEKLAPRLDEEHRNWLKQETAPL